MATLDQNIQSTIKSLEVCDRLLNLFADISLGSLATSQHKSKEYLVYGAGRRIRLIWMGYRHIIHVIPPDRVDTIKNDEGEDLTLYLNSTYLHLRGALDNYAWALMWEVDPDNAPTERPQRVGLFEKIIVKNPELEALNDKLSRFKDWHMEVKERRDPAAHRFPLYIPPAFLTPKDQKEYKELSDEWNEAVKKLEFETVEQINQKRDSIGSFSPYIVHDFALEPTPLYPTLINDISNFLEISDEILGFFKNR